MRDLDCLKLAVLDLVEGLQKISKGWSVADFSSELASSSSEILEETIKYLELELETAIEELSWRRRRAKKLVLIKEANYLFSSALVVDTPSLERDFGIAL